MAFGDVKGTWNVAANSIATTNNLATATGSTTVITGDLIVVVVAEQTNLTTTAVTDTLGNTYAVVQTGTDAGTITGVAYYTRVTKPGTNTNIIVTATSSTDNIAAVAASYTGPFPNSPKDQSPATASDTTSPFTCPLSGTLAQANELVVGWFVHNTANTMTATAPDVLDAQLPSQSVISAVLGHRVVTATASVSVAFAGGTITTNTVLGTGTFMQDLSKPFKNNFIEAAMLRKWSPPAICQPVNIALVGATPVVTYMPGRVVEWGTSSAKPYTQQQSYSPSLVLSAVIAAPFTQDDWPPPIRAKTQGLTWINQALTATTVNYIPGRVMEWGVAPPKPLLPPGAVGSGLALGAAPVVKPFLQSEWPVPQRPVRPFQFYQQSNILTAPVITYIPSRVSEWGVQRRQVRVLWDQPSNMALLTATPAVKPFKQDSWPLPTPPRFPNSARTWLNTFLPYTYQWREPFFVQFQRPRYTPQPQAINTIPLLTTPPPVKPFHQDSWPVPTRPIQLVEFYQQSNIIFTSVAVTYIPSRVNEWGVQLSAKAAPPVQPVNTIPLLTATPLPPFAQTDWPQPTRVKPTGQFATTRAQITPNPFKQTDWPQPIRVKPVGQTITRGPQINPVTDPLRQTDWPQPIRVKPMGQTWISSTIALRNAVRTGPFNQSDWPVPQRRLWPQAQSNPTNALYLPIPVFPPGKQMLDLAQRRPWQPQPQAPTWSALFRPFVPPIPPTPTPQGPRGFIRDYWDIDAYGRLVPGACIREG